MQKEPQQARVCKETHGRFVTAAQAARAELLRRWGLSLRQWSLLRGYNPQTVHRVVIGQRGRRGDLSRRIADRIQQDTGIEIVTA